MNVDGDLTAAVGALVEATTGGFSTSFVVLTLVEVVVVVFEVILAPRLYIKPQINGNYLIKLMNV